MNSEVTQILLDRFNTLENKIDKLDDRVSDLEKEVAVYNGELTRHIEGVQLAREQNELLRQHLEKSLEAMNSKITPVVNHVATLQAWGKVTIKIITTVGLIAGTIYSLIQIGLLK